MEIITSNDQLKEVVKYYSKEPYITIDTEFVRNYTYYPILCLVQIGTKDRAIIIDALYKGFDIEILAPLLKSTKVTKVFHSCSQDLLCLNNLISGKVRNIFDTQTAANFIGFRDNVGYAMLAEKMLGIKVDKTFQYSNWKKRPLPMKQLEYALADVTHLVNIYEKILVELKEKGRTKWAAQEMKYFDSRDYGKIDYEEQAKKLAKSSSNVPVLAKILEIREETAKIINRNKRSVFDDDILMQLASSDIKLEDKPTIKNTSLREAVHTILNNKSLQRKRGPKRVDATLLAIIKSYIKDIADKNGMNFVFIANMYEMEQAARGKKTPLSQGWRAELVGNDIKDFMRGKANLSVKDGKLQITKKRKLF